MINICKHTSVNKEKGWEDMSEEEMESGLQYGQNVQPSVVPERLEKERRILKILETIDDLPDIIIDILFGLLRT